MMIGSKMFWWRLNECNDVESLIDMGIEFQMWGVAKEKARLPIERFVRGVLSNYVDV